MAKKSIKDLDIILSEADDVEIKSPKKDISLIDINFGREDLDKLRDKINEIINVINK